MSDLNFPAYESQHREVHQGNGHPCLMGLSLRWFSTLCVLVVAVYISFTEASRGGDFFMPIIFLSISILVVVLFSFLLDSKNTEKEISLQGNKQNDGISESVTDSKSELPDPEDVGFEMPML